MNEKGELTNESTCFGCSIDAGNQLAHMEPGGCLFDENWYYGDEVNDETETEVKSDNSNLSDKKRKAQDNLDNQRDQKRQK